MELARKRDQGPAQSINGHILPVLHIKRHTFSRSSLAREPPFGHPSFGQKQVQILHFVEGVQRDLSCPLKLSASGDGGGEHSCASFSCRLYAASSRLSCALASVLAWRFVWLGQ